MLLNSHFFSYSFKLEKKLYQFIYDLIKCERKPHFFMDYRKYICEFISLKELRVCPLPAKLHRQIYDTWTKPALRPLALLACFTEQENILFRSAAVEDDQLWLVPFSCIIFLNHILPLIAHGYLLKTKLWWNSLPSVDEHKPIRQVYRGLQRHCIYTPIKHSPAFCRDRG